LRHPILYAEQMWIKQRFWGLVLIIAGALASVFLYVQLHRVDNNTIIWLLYVPSGLVLIGLLQLYRRRHQLEFREDGFHVGTFLSGVTIGYDRIRQIRVQPLKLHFQDGNRKRLGSVPMVKPLLEQNAVYIRLRLEPDEAAYVHRKLGSRIHDDGTLALPVPDPDAAAWELSSRTPSRVAVNQGGSRRKRRR
jgi:hypothetical protein